MNPTFFPATQTSGPALPLGNAAPRLHSDTVRETLYPTHIEIDHRVQSVLAFMQQTLQADDLLGVAEAVAVIAPAVWGRYRHEPVMPLCLSGDINGRTA